jgi:hypothetical protein
MKYRSIAAGTALLAAGLIAPPAMAVDCTAQFNPQQREIYSTLSPQKQKRLSSQTNKDGSPASCEFQKGILAMLANYTPDKRNSGFEYLADKMLAKPK